MPLSKILSASLGSGVGGKLLQVVQTVKTDTFSLSTGNTWTDITGLSVSITPSSSSNKILILYNVGIGTNGLGGGGFTKLLRGSTDIFIGDTSSNRNRVTTGGLSADADSTFKSVAMYLDSPSTTSSTTYKIQAYAQAGTGIIYINRTYNDTDNSRYTRDASSITVMEIAV